MASTPIDVQAALSLHFASDSLSGIGGYAAFYQADEVLIEPLRQQQFLHDVWSYTPGGGIHFLARLNRDPNRSQAYAWRDTVLAPQQKPDLSQKEGVDLFFTPLGFNDVVRSNASAKRSFVFFADLDDNYNRNALNTIPPKFMWETSPGNFQAIWITDSLFSRPTWDRINRNLTAFMGADKGGWHASKVLRIPGSINYKRGGVKVGDLISYTWSPSNRQPTPGYVLLDLPDTDISSSPNVEQPTPPSQQEWAGLFKQYWGLPPLGVRSRLMAKRVHDRSLELFMLSKDLQKVGINHEDTFRLLYGVSYNKFRDRPHYLWKLVLDG